MASPGSTGEPDLARGRQLYGQARWLEAYEAFISAQPKEALPAGDLELLARAAYLLGRDLEYVAGLEQAYLAHLANGAPMRSARCAFWIGHSYLFRGQAATARGWFARAQRLVGQADVTDRGYVLIAELFDHHANGDTAAVEATAAAITEIGRRFADKDLVAIGMMEQGHALARLGRAGDGVRLIDETMLAVTSGELSPIVAGIIYCNTIAFCRDVYQLRRVREWTVALTRWCETQTDMVAHTGVCLVHRAEIMTLGGAWDDALAELHRLDATFTQGVLNQRARGDGAYRQGEVHRLRGEVELAEAAYRDAHGFGREPQPGLALLRLAQGNADSAGAMIRRVIAETPRGLPRVALLPAYAQIMLAVGDLDAAAGASRELDEIATGQGSEAINAMSGQARGAVALAQGDGPAALVALRASWQAWQQLEAPYEAACVRVLLGQACRMLGDDDSAALELRAAGEAFAQLGALPDHAAAEAALSPGGASSTRHGLTGREVEILRLVATGQTNREIAAMLVLSEYTIARHLQNIFTKLGVSSRTAAAAFAHHHDLV